MSVANLPHVLVVDDDEAVRDSLQLLLKSAGFVVSCYASAEDFLSNYSSSVQGCLLLDVRMPGMSGMELHQYLRAHGSTLPVIIVTGHGDVPMAVEAMKHGAADFVEKPYDDDELLRRIRESLAQSVRERVQSEADQQSRQRLTLLTPREREVMDLLAQGKLNKVVAGELNISPRTVEVHRARIMEKLQIKSLADIVRISLLD